MPPPSPFHIAKDEQSWLDSELNLRSIDFDSNLLEDESMAPVIQWRVRYKGKPQYQLCKMKIQSLQNNQENRFVHSIYSRGTHCHIATSSSKGRPLHLSDEKREQVVLHVSALVTAGLIQKWKRTAFLSFPFVVPKASGKSQLIVDFAHLQGKYTKPILHMPAFPVVLRRLHPLEQGDYLVRIDLRAAFYNVPLPERLRDVTAIRFDGKTYVFKVLPMGLFISPAILQAIVQEVVKKVIPGPQRRDGMFAWIHLDDILIAADTLAKIQCLLHKLIRVLYDYGFYLAPRKSVLFPTQTLSYCGLLLDTRWAQYSVSTSRIQFFQQLLQMSARFSRQAWGYLAFWLLALGLSSIARLLNSTSTMPY